MSAAKIGNQNGVAALAQYAEAEVRIWSRTQERRLVEVFESAPKNWNGIIYKEAIPLLPEDIRK